MQEFFGLAEQLSDAFTVISYDRRGNSRSTGRAHPLMTMADQSDDAKAVIEGLAGGEALVFGNSGGALVGLTSWCGIPKWYVVSLRTSNRQSEYRRPITPGTASSTRWRMPTPKRRRCRQGRLRRHGAGEGYP